VTNRGAQCLATVASLAVGASFFALWFWLLPSWLNFRVDAMGVARWRWIGAALSVLGFAVALRCIWDFGWMGHGTPAPMAPPQRLVVVGFYRYVGHANLPALLIACVAVAGIALFVQLYEEPTLRRMFGPDYEEYCRNAPRWLPRMRAWTK